MTYFVLGLAFVAGFLVVFGVNLVLADIGEAHRERLRARLAEESRLAQRERARASAQFQELYEIASDDAGSLNAHKTMLERANLLMEQAGLRLRPTHLFLMAAALFGLLAGGMWWLSQNVIVACCMGLLSAGLPFAWVHYLRARRLQQLQSQLPDAFDLMASTMRAGQTISQALRAVVDESVPPLSAEFGYCYDQQNLGLSPEAAMGDLARRTGLLEIKIFVLAVTVHRQIGGNLSELLEKLAFVIRERYRIQGMIRALTAEGKLQAIILFGLPIVLAMVMYLVNREYMLELLRHPLLLLGMFGFMSLGALWMNRIISFDF